MSKTFKKDPRDNYDDFYKTYDKKKNSIRNRQARRSRVGEKTYIPIYDTLEERNMDREDY